MTPEPPRASPAPADANPDGLRVLLVDRYPRTLRFMTMVFTSSGCRASTASTAKEMLDLLSGEGFDLVVADSGLPGLDGPELLRVVRERQPRTPVVLTTEASSDPSAMGRLDQAYGHLQKPFALEEVQLLVERLRTDRRQRAPRRDDAAPGPPRPPRQQPGLVALSRITELALRGGDTSAYLERALDHTFEGLGARAALVVLRDGDGHLTATQRGDQALTSRVLAELSPRLDDLLRADHQGGLWLTGNRGGWTTLISKIPGSENHRGILCVAIGAEDQGVLEEAEALVPSFANVIALSLEKLILGEDLETHLVNTISSFVTALECRDAHFKGHSARVSLYAGEMAKVMGLSAAQVAVVRRAGMLHDLGALASMESAPEPKAPMTSEPLAPLGLHSLAGAKILKPLRFLAPEAEAIKHQHERYDGKGHPDGLIGDAIPLAARIVAVADALDSLVSRPPYGSALDIPTALRQIVRHAGAQFDPGVTEALARIPSARLAEISQFYDAGGEPRSGSVTAGSPQATFVGASKRLVGRNGSGSASSQAHEPEPA